LNINKSEKDSRSSTSRPIRKKEKWSDIISKSKNIDIFKPVNYITASEIQADFK
jgi:hypothetical protein